LGNRIQKLINNNSNMNIYKDYDHFIEMVPEFLSAHKFKII